ncbi:MAG: nucleotidyltransferase family protein [Candidatus Thermoplasmatota archaeon]|nr:nucleotidyltransferase family protein [Candidatus Thermoplasmatota archaeon]
MVNVSAIILASGKSIRFNSNKLLYKVNLKPIISYIIDNVSNSNFQERIIVLRNKEIEKYSIDKGFKTVWNKDFEKGMSTSIVHGIENISPNSDAAMIIPGDMPLLDPSALNSLIEYYKSSGKGISGFINNGTIISPVIFSRQYFEEILELKGDKGAKSIVLIHDNDFSGMEISSNILIDIDTRDDVIQFRKFLNHKD